MAKSKKEIELEPQIILNKPFRVDDYNKFVSECKTNNYKIVSYPNGATPTAIYGILQTQDLVDGKIVDTTEKELNKEKEKQISIIKNINSENILKQKTIADQLNLLRRCILAICVKLGFEDCYYTELKQFEDFVNNNVDNCKKTTQKVLDSKDVKNVVEIVKNYEQNNN